ncbi:MAG: DUF4870 domain-containing protein [Haloferacaceae archaeon]
MSTERDSSASQDDGDGMGDSTGAEVVGGTGAEEAPDTGVNAETSGTGLDSNVAGALSYLLGPLTGILFYLLEDDDEFVRFHGAQSTIVFGGLFVFSMGLTVVLSVLAAIPVVGWIAGAVLGFLSLLLAPVAFVAWLFLMYKAYQGAEYEVPMVAGYARKYAAPQ